jgi:DNA adenine methylase
MEHSHYDIRELFDVIGQCKQRGVYVALSIDGKKKSGRHTCDLPIPAELFERELYVNCGASMLKRFQSQGKSCHEHHVADRLLLTY